MEFKKYQHIERFGTEGVEGIELGECYVFPKIDGTNGSVWLDDGNIKAGSRNRELTLENDNQGFYAYILQNENIKKYLYKHPTHRLFGEWLKPHTLKTYRDDAWNRFYIFDVCLDKEDGELEYISYDIYKPLLEEFNLDYIPPIAKIKNANYENFIHCLKQNIFLIKDGQGVGEGIVIKNYCVTPDMKVLTKNLEYVPIGEIKEGDILVGFDEYPNTNKKIKYRYFKEAIVEHIHREIQPVYKIELSDGTVLKSTVDHRWLCIIKNTHNVWKTTEKINIGTKLRKILPYWNINRSYEAGYLQGVYDGEGSLLHCQDSLNCNQIQVIFNQLDNQVLNTTIEYAKRLGYNLSKIKAGSSNTQRIIILGGKKQNIKFLGEIRPKRLLDKIDINQLGGIRSNGNDIVTVVNKTFLGEQEIVVMQTSTGTFICEGFGAHNCFYNKYKKQIWAKIVTSEFKEQHYKTMGCPEINTKLMIEEKIVDDFCTEAFVEKEFAKIVEENNGWTNKYIPMLLGRVFSELIKEESWNIIKKYKNPTINYKTLNALVINKIKQVKKDIFA